MHDPVLRFERFPCSGHLGKAAAHPYAVGRMGNLFIGNALVVQHVRGRIARQPVASLADEHHGPVFIIKTAINHTLQVVQQGVEHTLAVFQQSAQVGAQLDMRRKREHLPLHFDPGKVNVWTIHGAIKAGFMPAIFTTEGPNMLAHTNIRRR